MDDRDEAAGDRVTDRLHGTEGGAEQLHDLGRFDEGLAVAQGAFERAARAGYPPIDAGFCCDQTAIYEPVRGITIWLLQYVKQNGTWKIISR